MTLQDLASSPPRTLRPMAGGVVVVRLAAGGEISLNIRTALAGADVVFCDEDAERGVLASAGHGAVVEFVPVNGGREWSRPVSLARARRLAGDGWRVVWVAAAKVELPADFERTAGSTDGGVGELVPVGADAPHPLATAFNGLAG